MRMKQLGWLLTAVLCLPSLAGATTVTWRLEGTVNNAFGLGGFGIQVGDHFSALLTFNDAATLNNPGVCAGGGRCVYGDPTIQINQLTFTNFGPIDVGFGPNDLPSNIIVRNNVAVTTGGPLTDGVSFSRQSPGDTNSSTQLQSLESWGVIFRTFSNLNLLSNGSIPSSPGALMQMENRTFQYCMDSNINNPNQCDLRQLSATIDSASRVPEPGSLGLLAFGLAGLGLLRRRTR